MKTFQEFNKILKEMKGDLVLMQNHQNPTVMEKLQLMLCFLERKCVSSKERDKYF